MHTVPRVYLPFVPVALLKRRRYSRTAQRLSNTIATATAQCQRAVYTHVGGKNDGGGFVGADRALGVT